jgi:uncharacterized protein with HEPN domain
MSKRDDIQLVLDMIESCERIQAYTSGSSGFESQMVCDAVTRNLEIIGEATLRWLDMASGSLSAISARCR